MLTKNKFCICCFMKEVIIRDSRISEQGCEACELKSVSYMI